MALEGRYSCKGQVLLEVSATCHGQDTAWHHDGHVSCTHVLVESEVISTQSIAGHARAGRVSSEQPIDSAGESNEF